MAPNYLVQMDEARGLLRLTVTGFWTPAMAAAFLAEWSAATFPLRRANRPFAVIADCRNFAVQSEEVGAPIAAYLSGSENPGRRAILMSSVLGKMQAQRAIDHPDVGVFMSESDAMSWLFPV